MNLGVVYGALIENERTDLATATIIHADLAERIGSLLPERCDKWWSIDAKSNADVVQTEVLEATIKLAVPYVLRYISTEAATSLWASGESPGITERQRTRYLAKLRTMAVGGSVS